MWEPRRLTTLWAFMACYRDSFTFYYESVLYSDVRHDTLNFKWVFPPLLLERLLTNVNGKEMLNKIRNKRRACVRLRPRFSLALNLYNQE
jgi:hypothetical protein